MYSLGIYSWHPPVHHIWYSSNWNGSPSGNIQPWSWGQNISPPAKYSGRTPLMFCRSCQSQPRCGKLLAQILEKSCVMLPAIYKFIDFLFDLLLFVIDIHQMMFISLFFLTPFDHFHFHGSGGLILWFDLRLWPIQKNVKTQLKHTRVCL